MKKNDKLYLSGPMTGLPNFNFDEFNRVALELREDGYTVINPAENDGGDQSKPWAYYLKKDLIQLLQDSNAIAVLPGWEKSEGASLEVHVAKKLGYPIYDANTRKPYRETILQEAQRLVHGDRGDDYGHPFWDFRRTAKIITGILMDKLRYGVEVEPRDVPLIMNGVKMSREVNKPKRDNRADGAGYWETLDMVDQFQTEQAKKFERDNYAD